MCDGVVWTPAMGKARHTARIESLTAERDQLTAVAEQQDRESDMLQARLLHCSVAGSMMRCFHDRVKPDLQSVLSF